MHRGAAAATAFFAGHPVLSIWNATSRRNKFRLHVRWGGQQPVNPVTEAQRRRPRPEAISVSPGREPVVGGRSDPHHQTTTSTLGR